MQKQCKTETVTAFPPPRVRGLLQRQCDCGHRATAGGECEDCRQKRPPTLHRAAATGPRPFDVAPPLVHEVLASPGHPLPKETRDALAPHFGHDFSAIRVHHSAKAAESARAVNARAYTVGADIVFGTGQYAPQTVAGRRLLAHELTHAVQQGMRTADAPAPLSLDSGDAAHSSLEREAERTAQSIAVNAPATDAAASGRREDASPRQGQNVSSLSVPAGTLQRQLITPLAPGGGFGGLMERDWLRTAASVATPYLVCSRSLQDRFLGTFFNHAYIDAPPFRYAVITPLCPASRWDNPLTGTTAQKWDNSPDPCSQTPTCLPCQPAPGVTDVGVCLRNAFTAYNNPSLYKGTGPNSNTFAGTLARACCAGMTPKSSALGIVPGWDDPPAPARAGATPCPPGPVC